MKLVIEIALPGDAFGPKQKVASGHITREIADGLSVGDSLDEIMRTLNGKGDHVLLALRGDDE